MAEYINEMKRLHENALKVDEILNGIVFDTEVSLIFVNFYEEFFMRGIHNTLFSIIERTLTPLFTVLHLCYTSNL